MSKNWHDTHDNKPVDNITIGTGQESWFIKNTFKKSDGYALIFESSYHEEYDDGWVVKLSQEGKEIERWNAKFITCIKWIV